MLHIAPHPTSGFHHLPVYYRVAAPFSWSLQVSRSFGDAQFKGSGCSAVPAVTAFSVGQREVFLLCGCDGFWSVMDPQGAVDFVAQQLQQGKDPKAATNRCAGLVSLDTLWAGGCTTLPSATWPMDLLSRCTQSSA